jgi:hypothetical protein
MCNFPLRIAHYVLFHEMNIRDEYKKFVVAQNRWWIIAAILLIAGELFFGVAERAIGRYLVWHNSGREKIGRSWEAAESRAQADTRLEQAQQEIRQRSGNLASLENFDQLLQFVQSNQRALLPLSQFAIIYRTVPEVFQPLLIPPETLLEQVSAGRAVNVLSTFQRGDLEIFLLDAEDRSAHQSRISGEQLRMMRNHGRELQIDLTRAEQFSQRIFSAEEFQRAIDELSREERAWLARQLPILTDSENRFASMAVSSETSNSFVEIAFALKAFRCLVYYLPEDWVSEHLWPALNENRFIKFE